MPSRRLCRLCLWAVAGLSLYLFLTVLPMPPRTIAAPATNVMQQGIEQYQTGRFQAAIALWQQALAQAVRPQDQAAIYNNLALAYRQLGQLSEAIAHWQSAIDRYQQTDASQVPKLAIEQAQAYSRLGQHQRAIDLAQSAVKASDPVTQAAAWGSLGTALWARGDYETAIAAHQKSLQLARQLRHAEYTTTALNNLGNVYLDRASRYRYEAEIADGEGDTAETQRLRQFATERVASAQSAFEQAAQSSGGAARAKALLNLNRLLARTAPDSIAIAQNRTAIVALLDALPNSRDKAYLLINLAEQSPSLDQAQRQLESARRIAIEIGDRRAESFALGSLGERLQSTPAIALDFLQQAQLAAQQVNAADSLYRWQWQTGRLLKTAGQTKRAIAAYEQAISTLQTLRSDLLVASTDLQVDFRDSVEPVYREMMQLLLEPAAAIGPEQRTANLTRVIDTLELLKLVELQNYFGDECVQVAKAANQRQDVPLDATLVYSVILNDHTELIVRSPQGRLTSHAVPLSRQQLQRETDTLRRLLEKRSTNEYLAVSKQMYDTLIRPLEADLAAAKTLVFIQDDGLRQVPMAALHDGQRFLIEKAAIATTPSLSLTAQTSATRYANALIAGLTVERPPFNALPNVSQEVAAVKAILGGTELVDQNFTLPNLEAQFTKQSYPVVHVATHGKFGVSTANTFLQAFDQRITLEQLDALLRSRRTDRSPVELLTLSACQTAVGDNRAALGFAGIAVRAGVKSALASLWYINDEATSQLIQEFYTQLKQPTVTKAQALQAAQVKLIRDFQYSHPAVWSPFVLIGTWR